MTTLRPERPSDGPMSYEDTGQFKAVVEQLDDPLNDPLPGRPPVVPDPPERPLGEPLSAAPAFEERQRAPEAPPEPAEAPEPAAGRELFVRAEPAAGRESFVRAEPAAGREPFVRPEPVAGREPFVRPEPVAGREPFVRPEPVVPPAPFVRAEPYARPEPFVPAEPVLAPESVPVPEDVPDVAETARMPAVVVEPDEPVEAPPPPLAPLLPADGGRAARRKAARHGSGAVSGGGGGGGGGGGHRAGGRTAQGPGAAATGPAQAQDGPSAPLSRVEARRAARAAKDSPAVIASRIVGELFITAGVLMLLFVTYQLWWTNVRAHQQANGAANSLQHQWDSAAGDPNRVPGTFSPGQGFAIMYIPKLDVKAPVAQGVSKPHVLDKGMIGHYDGALNTAMPWDKTGNFAVAAHRNTHGEPFRYINHLVPGDKVVVETATDYYTYQITSSLASTPPANTDVLKPVPPGSGFTGPGRYLTLTTCTPEFTSTNRLIVWGKLIEDRPRSKGKPDALVNG